MHCPTHILENGFAVRTHATLGTTVGMICSQSSLDARKPNARGEITGVVGGHGGDVYFVKHPGDSAAAVYCYTEFEPA